MPLTLSFLWPHHLWLLPALLVLPAAYVWLLLACPGIDTLEAAKMAADRGVRIYVVGLGTVDGTASMGEYASIYLQLDEDCRGDAVAALVPAPRLKVQRRPRFAGSCFSASTISAMPTSTSSAAMAKPMAPSGTSPAA